MAMMRTVLLAGAAMLMAGPAWAQARCKVMDPTGTPLNIRAAPNGEIIGQATNGAMVSIIGSARDNRGKPWVYVAHRDSGQALGWVFREFIACY